MDYTNKQLEEMVVGKPIDPTIEFYEQALLDVEESKAQGRRIYSNVLMIKRQVPGVTDYVAQRATPEDVRRWPSEYQAFKMGVQARKSPGLEVLHGISNVERQELIDRGYSTVERLAAATDVPGHLVHLQPPAQRIHAAIMAEEQNNAQQEEDNQQKARSPEEVLAEHRLDHGRDVGRPEVPRVQGQPREAREGPVTGGRKHRRQDWEVSFKL